MPLLDHFHPPLSVERPWEGIHSTWASTIATQLNQDQLPAEYFTMPLITVGGGEQVDVGTCQTSAQQEGTPGEVATQIWAPPQPPRSAVVDFVSLDVYEALVAERGAVSLTGARGELSGDLCCPPHPRVSAQASGMVTPPFWSVQPMRLGQGLSCPCLQ